jgi:hypothetical protein
MIASEGPVAALLVGTVNSLVTPATSRERIERAGCTQQAAQRERRRERRPCRTVLSWPLLTRVGLGHDV